jgi:hypothetical protein
MEDHRITKGKGGRPVGSKNAKPQVPGWHTEDEEAAIQGVSPHRLRDRARLGIGPKPVKHGNHNFYRDGGYAEYLEELHRRQNEPQLARRGRPRKNPDRSTGQRTAPTPLAARSAE